MTAVAELLAWQEHALCRDDPELFCDRDRVRLARHNCLSHCEVVNECGAWAADKKHRWDDVVVGGLAWVSRRDRSEQPRPLKVQPKPSPAGCSHCLQRFLRSRPASVAA